MITIGNEEDPELAELLRDITEEYYARPEKDRQDLIDCIRQSALEQP